MSMAPNPSPISRRLVLKSSLAAAGALALGVGQQSAVFAAETPLTFPALMGGMSHDMAIELVAFMPETLTINAGDAILWRVEGMEPHTVTFVKPNQPWSSAVTLASGASYDGSVAAGSPELEPGQTYRLTFTQPGDYPCVCLIHSAPNNQVMRGLVRVMPAGSPRPRLPANLRQLADEARRTLLVQGRRMRARAAQMAHGQGQNDRRVVGVGIDDGREVAVLRFFPSVLTVHTGEWVHFELLQGDRTLPPAAPHTVTFGQEPPEDALFVPSGDPTNYQGGDLHSGFLWATPPPGLPPLPTSFDVRFTKAGVFPYICALHDEAGMRGAIVVTD